MVERNCGAVRNIRTPERQSYATSRIVSTGSERSVWKLELNLAEIYLKWITLRFWLIFHFDSVTLSNSATEIGDQISTIFRSR